MSYSSECCWSWPPVWLAVSLRLARWAGLSTPCSDWLCACVSVCVCVCVCVCVYEATLGSWEMTSSGPESDRAPVTEPHRDSFTPYPTHTQLKMHTSHTLMRSVWCGKAVQSDPSTSSASTVLSPLRISSGLTTCRQLYFSQAMPSAAYSLLFASIGTRAYSCARSSYETRPNPPRGQKS